jgi:hypothetical protein
MLLVPCRCQPFRADRPVATVTLGRERNYRGTDGFRAHDLVVEATTDPLVRPNPGLGPERRRAREPDLARSRDLRVEAVHGQSVRLDPCPDAAHERDQRGLPGRDRHVQGRADRAARRGRQRDNRAATLGAHERQYGTRGVEGATHVHVDAASPVLPAQLVQRAHHRHRTGIVDDQVDSAKAISSDPDKPLHLNLVGDVGGDVDHLGAQCRNRARGAPQSLDVARGENYRVARAGEAVRDSRAKPAAGARDDRRA